MFFGLNEITDGLTDDIYAFFCLKNGKGYHAELNLECQIRINFFLISRDR